MADKQLLRDAQWMRERVQAGWTQTDVAEHAGVESSTVWYWCQKHGVAFPRRTNEVDPRLNDREWLREAYHERYMSQREIAKELGSQQPIVSLQMRELGVETRRTAKRSHPKLDDVEWLRQKWDVELAERLDIAAELDVSTTAVKKALEYHGFDVDAPRKLEHADTLHSVHWMYREYVTNKRTISEIADELDVSRDKVRNALDDHNITVRPRGSTNKDEPAEMNDYEWLTRHRVTLQWSLEQLAEHFGVAVTIIQTKLEDNDVADRWETRADNHPKLDDVEWLTEQRKLRRTQPAVADELGVKLSAVSNAYQRGDVDVQGLVWRLHDREWLTEKYHGEGLSQRQITELVDCTESAVSLAMSRLDIPVRPRTHAGPAELDDPQWLAETNKTQTLGQMAKHLGVDAKKVSAAFKRHGLTATKCRREPRDHPALHDREKLADLYDKYTQEQLAEHLDVPVKTVRKALRTHEIASQSNHRKSVAA